MLGEIGGTDDGVLVVVLGIHLEVAIDGPKICALAEQVWPEATDAHQDVHPGGYGEKSFHSERILYSLKVRRTGAYSEPSRPP